MCGKIFIVAVLICLASVTACPANCQCQPEGRGHHVVCYGDDILQDFASLPNNTVQLIISGLVSLKSLQPQNLITVPSSIRHLTITNSTLQQLEQSVFSQNLKSLLELDLSGNNIKTIATEAFKDLAGLRVLNLSRNDLDDLGMVLKPLVSLQRLDLSYNYIHNLLPTTFLAHTGLDYLCLDGNEIRSLNGDAFQSLSFLSHLLVRNCSIRNIQESFFRAIPKVSILDLGHNRLTSFPVSTAFNDLHHLKQLHIDNNKLQQLHAGQFAGLRLHTLSVSHNHIGSIPANAFVGLTVDELSVSENKMMELKPESLQPLAHRLITLNLAYNPIRSLHPDLFKNFRLLETLNISACSLTQVSVETFSHLYNLRKVDMSQNHLQNVSESMVKVLSRLVMVNMQDNAWLCDCHISPFRNWLNSPRSAHKLFCLHENYSQDCTDIKCTSPEHLKGKLISNLSDVQMKCGEGAARNGLPIPVQISIVIGCLLFSLAMLLLAIYLWKRGHTNKQLRKILFQKKIKSDSHEEEEDEENDKIEPFLDCDNESLKESHRSFVVQHYFDKLVTDPALLEPTSPSLVVPPDPFATPLQKDSMYSSNSSQYENSHKSCSVVVVGIESAV